MAAPKLNTVSAADRVRLGTAADVKAGTTRGQWKKILKSAHSRGFTVASAVDPSIPDALKARTVTSLRTEAQKQTAEAYKPVTAALDSQEARIKAWDDKRKQDDLAYAAWLNTQNQTILANAQHTAVTLGQAAQASRDGVDQAWAHINQQVAQNTQGGISGPADPSQMPALVAAQQASQQHAQTAADAVANNVGMGTGSNGLLAASINNSFAQQANASRSADISKALNDIMDSRTKTQLQQSSDYLSAFSKLKDNEITKAGQVQSNATAAASLNVQQDKLTLDGRKLDATVKNNRAKNKLASTRLTNDQTYKDAQLRLQQNAADYNGDGTVNQQDNVDKRADKLLSARKRATGTSSADRTYSRRITSNLQTTFSGLKDLHTQYDHKKDPTHNPKTYRHILVTRGANDAIISLAEAARQNGGRIPKALYGTAKNLGITHPEKVVLQ